MYTVNDHTHATSREFRKKNKAYYYYCLLLEVGNKASAWIGTTPCWISIPQDDPARVAIRRRSN